jgi:hypothetical protein
LRFRNIFTKGYSTSCGRGRAWHCPDQSARGLAQCKTLRVDVTATDRASVRGGERRRRNLPPRRQGKPEIFGVSSIMNWGMEWIWFLTLVLNLAFSPGEGTTCHVFIFPVTRPANPTANISNALGHQKPFLPGFKNLCVFAFKDDSG